MKLLIVSENKLVDFAQYQKNQAQRLRDERLQTVQAWYSHQIN